MKVYLLVTRKNAENSAVYVENWWKLLGARVGTTHTVEIWESLRDDNDAKDDCEIARGRLASGLMGGSGPYYAPNAVEVFNSTCKWWADAEYRVWAAEARDELHKQTGV